MVKKMYFLSLLALFTAPITAMSSMPMADVAAFTTQLNHINTQMNAIKRAWNIERAHIKMAEKASSTLYAAIKPTIEKVIASSEFTNQMNATITMQFDSIVNNNAAFSSVKTDNNLSDLFPNLKMNEYGLKLYKAMANKAYFLLLGQKLAEKAKEIGESVRKSRLDEAREMIA